MILQSNNLTIGYTVAEHSRSQPLLQNINFAVEKPCLIGVVGENGAGKSTLLKTVCGLTPPLSGSVILNDKDISSLSVKELAAQITYLPGTKTFHPNLTVKELLLLADATAQFSFYKIPELNKAQQAVLAQLGISHLTDKSLGKLSDGQYQLASVAFALCRNTPVILFDEPLAFLDFRNRKRLMNQLSDLAIEKQKSIIFSSHDLHVLHHCHSVWHLENGAFSVIEKADISEFVEGLNG